jgi:hypothetical protein
MRCVFERSSQALAIDASNADAQALLQRAILSTGWKPLVNTVFTPAPRKPAPPGDGQTRGMRKSEWNNLSGQHPMRRSLRTQRNRWRKRSGIERFRFAACGGNAGQQQRDWQDRPGDGAVRKFVL